VTTALFRVTAIEAFGYASLSSDLPEPAVSLRAAIKAARGLIRAGEGAAAAKAAVAEATRRFLAAAEAANGAKQ
jgi:hypothetical protein